MPQLLRLSPNLGIYGSESSTGAKVPWNSRSSRSESSTGTKVLCVDFPLPGTKVLGKEKSRYRLTPTYMYASAAVCEWRVHTAQHSACDQNMVMQNTMQQRNNDRSLSPADANYPAYKNCFICARRDTQMNYNDKTCCSCVHQSLQLAMRLTLYTQCRVAVSSIAGTKMIPFALS